MNSVEKINEIIITKNFDNNKFDDFDGFEVAVVFDFSDEKFVLVIKISR